MRGTRQVYLSVPFFIIYITNEWGALFMSISKKIINANLIREHESMFRCPVCSEHMTLVQLQSLVCFNGHSFDLSRQGYLNLLTRSNKTKYSQHLFESRKIMSDSGFFDPLVANMTSRIVGEIKQTDEPIRLLDAGCGEGTLLSMIQRRILEQTAIQSVGVGLDLAKEGINTAAKHHAGIIWCVADLAKCPLADKQFLFLMNILSPSNYDEFHRLLADDGIIIKAVPGSAYLQELRAVLHAQTVSESYSNQRVVDHFRASFHLLDMIPIHYPRTLDRMLLKHLIQMTPLSWGAPKALHRQALDMNINQVTIDLVMLVGKKMW